MAGTELVLVMVDHVMGDVDMAEGKHGFGEECTQWVDSGIEIPRYRVIWDNYRRLLDSEDPTVRRFKRAGDGFLRVPQAE